MPVPLLCIFVILSVSPTLSVEVGPKLIGGSRSRQPSGHLDPIQVVEDQILPYVLRERRQYEYGQHKASTIGEDASLKSGVIYNTGTGYGTVNLPTDHAPLSSSQIRLFAIAYKLAKVQGLDQAKAILFATAMLRKAYPKVEAVHQEGRAHGDQYNGGRRHYAHTSQPDKSEPAKDESYKAEVATVVKHPPVAPVVTQPVPPHNNQTETEGYSEAEFFATALAAGIAVGQTKIQANLFADSLTNIQLVFQANGLEPSEDLPGLVTAFDNALIAGAFQAMSDIDIIHFAAGFVAINVIHQVQLPAAMTPYADTYATALAIGLQSLMGKKQATEFAKSVMRIQSDFGGQSEAEVRMLGIEYQTMWTVGLGLGMTQTQIVRFATVMLQIRARLGVMPLATVTSYAQEFVADVLTATQQGMESTRAIIFAQVGMLARAGVGNLLQPANP